MTLRPPSVAFLLAGLLLAAPAWAQPDGASSDPGREDPVGAVVGLPVAQVSLEAPEGGLPRENLEPLLRVVQGQPLDLGDVRSDVALLYRAGDFAAVEAVAEPWFIEDEQGEVRDAVRIIYRVRPPPRLEGIEIDGVRGDARRVVQRSLGVQRGGAFYPEAELGPLEVRVQAALAGQGWPEARAAAMARVEDEPGRLLVLELDVAPGEPQRWGEVVIEGEVLEGRRSRARRCNLARPGCGPDRRHLRRILGRHGVARGRRVVRPDLERAMIALREELAQMGWLQASVRFALSPELDGRTALLVNIEAGDRLTVEVERKGRAGRLPRQADLQEVLGLYEGTRPGEGTAEEAARRLQTWLHRRGHREAKVSPVLLQTEDGFNLVLEARPGPRFQLQRIEVEGARSFSPSYIAAALREADPEGLGRRLVSDEGLDRALSGVREFYRGQGFLDAKLHLVGVVPTRGPLSWLRPRRRLVEVQVQVEEGPRTLLMALEVDSTAEPGLDIGQEHIEAVRAEMVGGPYLPSRLEAEAEELAELLRARGYLNADVRVETSLSEDRRQAVARLVVRPGNEVRLRSIVIQGNRRTRRRVIERELTLEVGEPITPEGIRRTRSNLYSLDLFRVVSPELVGDDDRSRDLLIVVDEKPNILLEAGGGIATDQGIRVNTRATHRNLGGLGHKVSALGQVGYGWFGDEWRLDLDQPVWQAGLRYSAPHVPGPGKQLVLDAILGETLQEPVYRMWRSGGTIGLRSDGLKWEGWIGYRAQVRRLEDVETGALVKGDPWVAALDLAPDVTGRPTLPSETRLVTGPGLLVLRDGRDDPFNPTRGNYFSSLIEVSDGLVSHLVTVRGEMRLEQLLPVGPLVLNLGGRVGAGWARGEATTLPLEERFYLGGSGSVRGFRLNTIGPANYAARPNVPFSDELEPLIEGAGVRGRSNRWVPTGGDALASATAELRVPLPVLGLPDLDSTSWVVFADLGRVSFLDPAVEPTSALRDLDRPVRIGIGTGIRIATPVGPAALDLGINPWPQVEREEPTFMPHLSLGEL